MFSRVSRSFSSIIGKRSPLQQTLSKSITQLITPSPSPCSIHPTAIVHPNAIIGQDVSIGPFCTVGPNAKLGNGCQLYPGSHVFGDTLLGERCTVMAMEIALIFMYQISSCYLTLEKLSAHKSSGAIVGEDLPGSTVIGDNNLIGHHAVVGARCQDLKYKLGDQCYLHVGDNNDIREFTSIHRSSKSNDSTIIGDHNLVMGSCHIAHDCKVGNNNIFANNTLLAGHIVVEDFAHTAGATVVHQFCQIGSYAFLGGGSVVSQDVPKYMIVTGDRAQLCGLNLEGLRRHGFSSEEIRSMRKAYRKIFMSVDAKRGGIEYCLSEVEQDEELARFEVVSSMVQSIRDSFKDDRRGICMSRHRIK